MSEFARLKPRELLMATEKSMLNGQLLNLHLQLIDRKKELNDQQHVRCRQRLTSLGLEIPSLRQQWRGLPRAVPQLHCLPQALLPDSTACRLSFACCCAWS